MAAILRQAGVSTRAFYRHFASKDALFLAMLQTESEALQARLERIPQDTVGGPVAELRAWIMHMFDLCSDPRRRSHMDVLESDEVRTAKGYWEVRDTVRALREHSLVTVLERGRRDGVFPLAQPAADAVAISGTVSRLMGDRSAADHVRAGGQVLDFALRALGAPPDAADGLTPGVANEP